MQHQILIASYHKDFVWLRHLLRSMSKFSTGFLPPVVAVTADDMAECRRVIASIGSEAIPKFWEGPGFGRAQNAMMHGDILCPDADYFWLLGSDCLATRPFSPADYCRGDGLPYMLYHTWEHCAKHSPEVMFWRKGTEKALGWTSHGEFMRRLPLAYPTKMMMGFREHIEVKHGMHFPAYVYREVNVTKNFSESNVMGEWAWKHAEDYYRWVNLDEGWPTFLDPAPPFIQFWSHGGLDRPRDGMKETPGQVITRVLGSL